ncbi:MAG: LytR/AlgR family response regulator transcription factor [Cryomorphaceae bacterium]
MQTIIVEDDHEQQEWLENILKTEFPNIQILAKVDSVTKAVESLSKSEVDFVIMDVMIKGGTSFDVLEKLGDFDFHVVFTTSFEEYAIRAFRQAAIDFLLKPIDRAEFIEAIKRVEQREEDRKQKEQYELLISNYARNSEDQKIAIPDATSILFVHPRDIIRCISDNSYTTFHFANRKPVTISKSIKHCEQILDGMGFYRVHNRVLVNLRHIEKYKRGEGGSILLSDGAEVDISRRRKESFMRAFKEL